MTVGYVGANGADTAPVSDEQTTMTGAGFFSKSYSMARARFIAAACEAGARMDELHLDASGPYGEPLAIELAWFGSSDPERVMIHTSGIHGVEGFAGSAIQLALLSSGFTIPADAALLLVHCLNPYGMAWLRRVNENNVDLNRNFVPAEGDRVGAAVAYRRMNGLLNPASKPRRLDFFYPRASGRVLRHGMPALRQAIAEGQYDFPKGLFYGGDTFETGPLLFLGWLSLNLQSVRKVFAVDVHTGLGRWGNQTLFYRSGGNQDSDAIALGKQLGQPLVADAAANGAYTIRGMLSGVFDMLESVPDWSFVLQEFGTFPPLKVLNALRQENRWHLHGRADPEHWSKQRLRTIFAPDDRAWRNSVVERGVALCRQSMAHLFSAEV